MSAPWYEWGWVRPGPFRERLRDRRLALDAKKAAAPAKIAQFKAEVRKELREEEAKLLADEAALARFDAAREEGRSGRLRRPACPDILKTLKRSVDPEALAKLGPKIAALQEELDEMTGQVAPAPSRRKSRKGGRVGAKGSRAAKAKPAPASVPAPPAGPAVTAVAATDVAESGWRPEVDPQAYDPDDLPEGPNGTLLRPDGYMIDADNFILNPQGRYVRGQPPEDDADLTEWRLRYVRPGLEPVRLKILDEDEAEDPWETDPFLRARDADHKEVHLYFVTHFFEGADLDGRDLMTLEMDRARSYRTELSEAILNGTEWPSLPEPDYFSLDRMLARIGRTRIDVPPEAAAA